MIEARFDRGVYLPREDLWLDPWTRRGLAFVSHAHSDHTGRHSEIICSETTARLMRARLGAGLEIAHPLPFGRAARIGSFEARLLPAGHVLGSAQIFIATDRGTLLYTGDFKLRPGLSAERAEWLPAETLIMETTYGLPRFVFPPSAEVIADILRFCAEAVEDGMTPVLLGYSLGKAQELLGALANAGLTPMLHGSVAKITRVYEELGARLPPWVPFDAAHAAGHALIFPPGAARSRALAAVKNRRVAAVTGWAMEPGAIHRLGADAAFPLSDHAGYDDLLRYVELVRPARVLTLHGCAREFARDLRARGVEAWSLTGDDQLEFSLAFPEPENESGGETCGRAEEREPSQFETFARLGERLAKISGRLAKQRLLAEYLSTLEEDDLRRAAVYLSGLPFPRVAARPLQTGWAVIKRALLRASGAGEARLRELSRRHRDAAATAEGMLRGRTRPEPVTFADVERFFERLDAQRGPLLKADLLADFFRSATAVEGKYVVKILTGDLRIGLGEGLIEEALAEAFNQDPAAVREAAMLTGDIGRTAALARAGRLAEAGMRPFNPVKVMLASPEPNARAVWARFHPDAAGAGSAAAPAGEPPQLLVEDKFDGIRAQIHKAGGRAEIYSRDLKRVTDQFPEIARAALSIGPDVVLDAEIVACAADPSRRLGFNDLQKRLGRRGGDLFLGGEIPVAAAVFDLLWLDGEPLLKLPLRERRRRLDAVALPPGFRRAGVTAVGSAEEIEAEFLAARRRGNEGLMIKDPESVYTPGRRGLAWIKLKRELATLDVVVVAVEEGHGKRRGLLSDMTFAVRDDATGELVEIGKAYSGLTDAELAELTEHFEERTIERKGVWRRVEPDVVLEVAFDAIRPSSRHRSGLALRFPRIKALRRDKTAADIDTVSTARSLCDEPPV